MKSPFTGIEMQLVKEKEVLSYRKDKFEVYYYSFECDKTKERFTNDELDLRNINQVHNLYREKYLINNNMKNLTQSIDLQLEKLNAIRFLLKHVETDNNHQSTSAMLKALKEDIEELIKSDF